MQISVFAFWSVYSVCKYFMQIVWMESGMRIKGQFKISGRLPTTKTPEEGLLWQNG